MSDVKKRSGFQITSVTPDVNQWSPSVVPASFYPHRHGSSSQPTTPSLKRKYTSHDSLAQGAGASRFRVVKLAVGGAGSGGRGGSYRRGRWTCKDSPEGAGFKRMMDITRHAHSLESLQIIDRDTAHVLIKPIRERDRAGPTYHQPINSRLLGGDQPMAVHCLDSLLPTSLLRPHIIPPPLRLDVDAAGRSVLRLSHSQPSSPPAGLDQRSSLDRSVFHLPGSDSTANNSLVAIDNKIEQALDLVKSHLMLAVREEVELLREQIRELKEKNQELETENRILTTLMHSQHDNNAH